MKKFILGKFESQLISKIYNSALQIDLWRSALDDIRNRMGALEATLIFYDKSCRSRNFAKAAVASDEMNNRFVNEFIDVEISTFQSMIHAL